MCCFRALLSLPTLVLLSGFGLWGATRAQADLYQWVDAAGVIQVTDERGAVPAPHGQQVKVYRAEPSLPPGEQAVMVAGQVTGEHGLGAFATKLALDLGLIKQKNEDALGALS